MTRRVLKFGGSALADGEGVRRAAEIVREYGGPRPVVVVSAHEGVTRMLQGAAEDAARGVLSWDQVRVRHRTILRQLELSGDLLDRHLFELRGVLDELRSTRRTDQRTRDFVLSFGERMSARVVSAALRQEGIGATPVDAFDLGLVTEHGPGRARPLDQAALDVCRSLESMPGVPVVTGFLAVDRAGHLTTLGRNGTDLSAVWIGAAIDAERVDLWKSVPGILCADPVLVPGARLLPQLGWEEATELAAHGSEVLHPAAIEPARRAGLEVRILDVRDPGSQGTRIHGRSPRAGPVAVAHMGPLALVERRLDLSRDHGPQLVELFTTLGDLGLEPYLSNVTGTEVCVLVPDSGGLRLLGEGFEAEDRVRHGLGMLALVGGGVGEDAELRDRVEASLRDACIELVPGPRESRAGSLVWFVQASDLARAVRMVGERWLGVESRPEPPPTIPNPHPPGEDSQHVRRLREKPPLPPETRAR